MVEGRRISSGVRWGFDPPIILSFLPGGDVLGSEERRGWRAVNEMEGLRGRIHLDLCGAESVVVLGAGWTVGQRRWEMGMGCRVGLEAKGSSDWVAAGCEWDVYCAVLGVKGRSMELNGFHYHNCAPDTLKLSSLWENQGAFLV